MTKNEENNNDIGKIIGDMYIEGLRNIDPQSAIHSIIYALTIYTSFYINKEDHVEFIELIHKGISEQLNYIETSGDE